MELTDNSTKESPNKNHHQCFQPQTDQIASNPKTFKGYKNTKWYIKK